MSHNKRSLISVQQDYNNFINTISARIPLQSTPYISIKQKCTLFLNQPLVFIVEDNVTLKHVRPIGLKRLEVTIDFLMTHSDSKFKCYYEDMLSSSLNIRFRAINTTREENNYFGFHFDLHNPKKKDETKIKKKESIEQLHPKYHTQFLQNPLKENDFNYGNSLQLDIPRFTHFPMDFILGTSFVLANFLPHTFEELKSDTNYLRIQKSYQQSLWKPYLETLNNLLANPKLDCFIEAHQLHPYWI